MKRDHLIQVPRLLIVFFLLSVFLYVPRNVEAQTCATATIWASPPIVHYRTVISDSEDRRSEPNFTVFIELPDGSAGDIDPGSIKLNRLSGLEERSIVGDANNNGIADLMIKSNRSVLVTGDGVLSGKELPEIEDSTMSAFERVCADLPVAGTSRRPYVG